MRKYIIGFIFGAVIFSGITAFATTQIVSSNVGYKNTTVESAIDTLYTKAKPDYNGETIFTPSNTIQIISTKDTILKSNIIINQIPSTYKELSSLTNELTASDLLSGKQAYKADGTVVNGNISTYTGSTSITPTDSSQILETKNKYLNENIIINAPTEKIPTQVSTLTTQGATYTMKNDGYITGTVRKSSSYDVWMYINDEIISVCPGDTDNTIKVSLYAKKGDVVKTHANRGIYDLKVYEFK